jgi:hypothetical protein
MDDWRIDAHHFAFGGYLAAMLIGLLAGIGLLIARRHPIPIEGPVACL